MAWTAASTVIWLCPVKRLQKWRQAKRNTFTFKGPLGVGVIKRWGSQCESSFTYSIDVSQFFLAQELGNLAKERNVSGSDNPSKWDYWEHQPNRHHMEEKVGRFGWGVDDGVAAYRLFAKKQNKKTSSFCPLTESGSWMRMEISGREQKWGKKRVEVQEVMQKGQPLWCTSEISFSFISSKSAGGNYLPLIVVKLSFIFLSFFFIRYMFCQLK